MKSIKTDDELGILVFNWKLESNGLILPNYETNKEPEQVIYEVNPLIEETINDARKLFQDDLNKRLQFNPKADGVSNDNLVLALEEVMRNHFEHSSLKNPIIVDAYFSEKSVSTVTRSFGSKFNPGKARESYKTAKDPFLMKIDGRGLFIVEKMTDRFIIIYDIVKAPNYKDFSTQTAFQKFKR